MLPPDEAGALKAVKVVQALNGSDLEKRVRNEIGDPLLALFALLAKSVAPKDDDRAIAQKVHLMVLGYLTRGELAAAPAAAPAPKPQAPKKPSPK